MAFNNKRDTFIGMYLYAKDAVNERIEATKNDVELNADYRAEAEQMEKLFTELVELIQKDRV